MVSCLVLHDKIKVFLHTFKKIKARHLQRWLIKIHFFHLYFHRGNSGEHTCERNGENLVLFGVVNPNFPIYVSQAVDKKNINGLGSGH